MHYLLGLISLVIYSFILLLLMSLLFLFFAPLESFLSAKHGVLSGDVFFFSQLCHNILLPEVIMLSPNFLPLPFSFSL